MTTTSRADWWRDYPPPANPMARAAEQMELAAHKERMKNAEYADARRAQIDRAWAAICRLERRDLDPREPNPAFDDALAADPCLLMRIQRALGEELEQWRARRASQST